MSVTKMDARMLIAVLATLLASAVAITVTDPPATENPFVPGVFIAADALKSLQDKAKPDSNGALTRTEVPPKVSKKNDQLSNSPNMNPEQTIQGYQQMQEQQMNQPMGNQQSYIPDQQSAYSNQQLSYPNQPMLNQPQVYGNQPQTYGPQQGMFLMNQPGYNQPNGMGSQGYVLNNPSYQQPMMLNQQPTYQNPQGIMYQQPSYNQQPALVAVAQQPNGPLFVPNGQLAQPNMVANPNLVGNPTLITNNPGNSALYANPVQSQGNFYAMIPVNGQNTMANPNLGNNNAYFVPVQQMPANTVLLRDTSK